LLPGPSLLSGRQIPDADISLAVAREHQLRFAIKERGDTHTYFVG